MNSLEELNGFSQSDFLFNDTRLPDVVWSNDPIAQTYNVDENDSIPVLIGGRLSSIINQPEPLRYTIDLSAAPAGTTVTWGNLSGLGSGNLVANNSSAIYTVYGIKTVTDWNIVKSPIITMPANPPDIWFFNSNVRYTSNSSINYYAWQNTVNVSQLDEISAGSTYYYTNLSQIITNTPRITDLSQSNLQTGTYSLTITPTSTAAFGNLSSTGNTATTNFNNSTKVYTISGTKANVNSHLANLTMFPVGGVDISLNLNFNLYNPVTAFTSTSIQSLVAQSNLYISPGSPTYYDKNTITSVQNAPYVFDVVSNIAATYNLKITSLQANALSNVFSNASRLGGTSQYFTANDTAVITGNKNTINQHLGNLFIQAEYNYVDSFNLVYTLTVPGGNTAVQLQPAFLGNSFAPISNIAINRTFISNDGGQNLWPTQVPYITETLPGTYTVVFSSDTNIGVFGQVSGGNVYMTSSTAQGTNVYSLSGSRDAINGILPKIRFSPFKNVSGSQTMRYKQYYDSTLQLDQTIGLFGQVRTTKLPTLEVAIRDTWNYPYGPDQLKTIGFTWNQANYMLANIIMVGGGGGAGGSSVGSGASSLTANAVSLSGQTGAAYTVGRGGKSWNENADSLLGYAGTPTRFYTATTSYVASGAPSLGNFYGTGGANGSPLINATVTAGFVTPETFTINNSKGAAYTSYYGYSFYLNGSDHANGRGGARCFVSSSGALYLSAGDPGAIYIKFYE